MLVARGPLRDLGLTAEAALTTAAGPTRLGLDGRLDIAAHRLALQRLEAQAADQTLRLLAPAVLDLADGVAVDRLRLGLGTGSIELAGRLVPPLDLNAKLSQLPLELASLAAPDLPLTGTLAGEVRLSGPLEALVGSVRLEAAGLRPTRGAGRGLPPAEVKVAATLGPSATQIDASAQAGTNTQLRLRGTLGGRLPFAPGALDLRADGRVDLALLDPLLTAAGRQASGQAVLDARLMGTLAAPSLSGSLRLTNGALWDRGIGLVLTQVQGRLLLAGEELRLDGLTARAGPGTLALAGTVGVLAPGIPVDLRLTARDARPLQRDLLDAQGDADLRLTGAVGERLNLEGRVQLDRVEVRLPERLPANIVTLEVRELGERRSGPPGQSAGARRPLDLGLDLVLSAPRNVTVRGRGVDAELGGEVRVRGTLADPLISGGFDLARGDYDLVGQRLRFSRGRLGFDGAAGLDPNLDLEARVTAAGAPPSWPSRGPPRPRASPCGGSRRCPRTRSYRVCCSGWPGDDCHPGRPPGWGWPPHPWRGWRWGVSNSWIGCAPGSDWGAWRWVRTSRAAQASRAGASSPSGSISGPVRGPGPANPRGCCASRSAPASNWRPTWAPSAAPAPAPPSRSSTESVGRHRRWRRRRSRLAVPAPLPAWSFRGRASVPAPRAAPPWSGVPARGSGGGRPTPRSGRP
jgi:hypothetical protein